MAISGATWTRQCTCPNRTSGKPYFEGLSGPSSNSISDFLAEWRGGDTDFHVERSSAMGDSDVPSPCKLMRESVGTH